jgi:hypothetical protein
MIANCIHLFSKLFLPQKMDFSYVHIEN